MAVVFDDCCFGASAFDGDLVDFPFLAVDLGDSTPGAVSNPKVNCSGSGIIAVVLAGFSSSSLLLLASRASPFPERGTSHGIVNPTT